MIISSNTSHRITTTPGREYTFAAQGNFGSGTLSLEWSFDGTTWSPLKDIAGPVAFTESGGVLFTAPSGHVRATLAEATTPNITAHFTER